MITITKKLMSPSEIKHELGVNESVSSLRLARIKEIQRVLAGEDNRLLLIAGPCSADNEEAFYGYLQRLSVLRDEVESKILIVPRLYTAKPRSKGDSYKGIMYSKHPSDLDVDLGLGILTARKMFITALKDYGFVCADELLHTDTYEYFDDVASYAVIGARNSESQQHRSLASGLDIPVAIKNPTNGSLESLCNAVCTAQKQNSFLYNNAQVSTSGNQYAHAVLRGGMDRYGKHFSNCSIPDLEELCDSLRSLGVKNPAIIIDVNHSNSAKHYENQSEILLNSYKSIKVNSEVGGLLKGFMLESYLKDGACSQGEYEFGKSVTDGCLGFEKSERLIKELAELI